MKTYLRPQEVEHTCEASLVSNVHFISVLVEDEIGVFFIDGIVGEMHAHISKIGRLGRHIGFSSESGKAFLKQVYPFFEPLRIVYDTLKGRNLQEGRRS